MNIVHTFRYTPLTILILLALTLAGLAQTNKPSDLKTGSVLVFPYYSSQIANPIVRDTRISIHNHGTTEVKVHLYFLENVDCQQADMFVSLTANGSITMRSSTIIPDETGYLIAVATDPLTGAVLPNAGLTGNAFVQAPAGTFGAGSGAVLGNYGALVFNAYNPILPVNNQITLNFNGTDLDLMPVRFAAEIQRPVEAVGQTIVLAGLNGSVVTGVITGAAQTGIAEAYNEIEEFRSARRFISGSCHSLSTVTNGNPAILGFGLNGLSGFIATGTNGVLKFTTAGAAGLLITPANTAGWSGIRGLTCLATSNTVSLVVPAI